MANKEMNCIAITHLKFDKIIPLVFYAAFYIFYDGEQKYQITKT